MKHPWRRVGAYLIDYVVILLWIAALALMAEAGWVGLKGSGDMEFWARASLQAQAFGLLTGPVILYFILCERSGWRGTIGKRLTNLKVEPASFPKIILRNILKFLPWEMAHTAIWQGSPMPLASEPNTLGWTLIVVSMGLCLLYIIGLFVGSGRTLYDRIAGTRVQIKSH